MDSLEPIINLLAFLTALSVAAERITNVIKLRSERLRTEKETEAAEKEREHKITLRAILVGIVLALLLKADIIAALHRLDAPWQTMGWVQMRGPMWIVAPEARNAVTFTYTIIGSIVTGAGVRLQVLA